MARVRNVQMTRRSPFRIAIIVGAVLAALVAVPVGYVIRERHKCDQRLVHALCETDYQGLLNACRELSQRVAARDLEPKTYVLRSHLSLPGRFTPAPEVAGFPRAILDVDPVLVKIDRDGRVWVALYIYPDQGLFAYPENYLVYRGARLGDVEIIPGLWFSDNLYRLDEHPDFVKYVDELIQKGRDYQRSIKDARGQEG